MGNQCWGYGGYFHASCLGELDITDRVWVWPACRENAKDLGMRDLVLDRHLMHRVCRGALEEYWEPLEKNRVQAPSQCLRWEAARLWHLGATCDRLVPPIWQR